jgi:hypothetical protein
MAVGDRKRGKGGERETIYAGYSRVGEKKKKEILGRTEQRTKGGGSDESRLSERGRGG